MPDWVYRADSDPDLAKTQPVQFQKFITGQLDLQYSWLFAMLPPPDLASLGNNLFLSDPAFQHQQEGFVAFDQEMEDYEEDDDYDEGEIQEDEEDDDVESVDSGKVQATPPINPSTPVPNHAKAPLSQPLLRQQNGSSNHPNSSPMSNDKEAAQMKLEAMRAKLLASRKAGAIPAVDQNKNSAPQKAPPAATVSHLSPEIQSSTIPRKNTNGPSAEDVNDLVQEFMAAAEAQKNGHANGEVNGSHVYQLPQSEAGSTALVNAQEQYSKIQSLSARLPQRENTEGTKIGQDRPPEKPRQAQTRGQNNKQPQTTAGKGARPVESSVKKIEVQSKPPSRPMSRRQSTEEIVVKLPNDLPSITRPSSRQPSPVRQGRPQNDLRPEPKPFVAGLHPEIEEWLELTGYHDPEYRQATLNLMRKRKRLDELQSSLKQQELEFQEAFQAQSQAAQIVVGRRASSLMPPPPVPSRISNGNVSNTNISFDNSTAATPAESAFKRQRSPEANDLVIYPPQKVQRPTYQDDDREYKIRSATEQNHSRPTTPKYDQWRPARPRGGALESRIRAGGEAFPSADYGAHRYYEEDESTHAQRGSYYDDYADRDRGRARDWNYETQRSNTNHQRGRGPYRGRGNNHNKDNERGARRG